VTIGLLLGAGNQREAMGIDDYDLLHSVLNLIVELIRRLPRFDSNRIICSQLSPKGSQPFGRQGKGDHSASPLFREKTDHKVGGVKIHAKVSHHRPPF
jgi:hypothetical protein